MTIRMYLLRAYVQILYFHIIHNTIIYEWFAIGIEIDFYNYLNTFVERVRKSF